VVRVKAFRSWNKSRKKGTEYIGEGKLRTNGKEGS
jgi:hypothetical protein